MSFFVGTGPAITRSNIKSKLDVISILKSKIGQESYNTSEVFMNRIWNMLCLAVAAAICFALPASADIVSGRILGPDEKPVVNGTFTARNPKGESTVLKTDKSGNFSVYLDPGKYTVTS